MKALAASLLVASMLEITTVIMAADRVDDFVSACAGDYRLENRFTIKISAANSRLETTWLGEKIALIPESEALFFEEDSDRTFRFVKNGNGKVTSLIISVPEELTLQRLP